MEETLGKRIVQHRKQLGLTQDQLAERLGVTAQAVSKWENDQSCPDITMLPKLAEIFSTTTDALLGHETPPVCQAEVVETSPGEEAEKGFEFHWDGGRKHALGYAVLVLMVGVLTLLSNVLGWSASLAQLFADVRSAGLVPPVLLFPAGLHPLRYIFSAGQFGSDPLYCRRRCDLPHTSDPLRPEPAGRCLPQAQKAHLPLQHQRSQEQGQLYRRGRALHLQRQLWRIGAIRGAAPALRG